MAVVDVVAVEKVVDGGTSERFGRSSLKRSRTPRNMLKRDDDVDE